MPWNLPLITLGQPLGICAGGPEDFGINNDKATQML